MSLTRRKIILLSLAVFAVAIVLLVNFTEVCNLEAVTLNGEPLERWHNEYGLSGEKMIFDQPVDSLAATLLQRDGIVKVDIDYRLPGEMNIRTNNFEPVCFVLDKESGKIKGLNAQARVVSLGNTSLEWENPVITNVSAGLLYDFCDDPRVRKVVPRLVELREENIDLYRLIDEIDFGAVDRLSVSISGLPYRLIVTVDGIVGDLNEFVEFLENFDADLESARTFDLRFDNMIVQAGDRK